MQQETCPVSEGSSAGAEAFKAWRQRLGLNQTEAATLLGINRWRVCRIEQGQYHFDASLRLLCWLLEDTDIRKRVTHYLAHGLAR